MSLFSTLVLYSDYKEQEQENKHDMQIKCTNLKDGEKFSKIFYNSPPEEHFTENTKKTYIENIRRILDGWYTNFYSKEGDKSYKDFLNYIILQWYDTQCTNYNDNENYIIYHFGYVWKMMTKDRRTIIDIDDALTEIDDAITAIEADDKAEDDTKQTDIKAKISTIKATISIIEENFTEKMPTCERAGRFNLGQKLIENIQINFIEPVDAAGVAGVVDVADVANEAVEGNQPNNFNVGGGTIKRKGYKKSYKKSYKTSIRKKKTYKKQYKKSY